MDMGAVEAALRGIPFMTPSQGRRIYSHVLETAPAHVLELGTCHGTSAAYIAAALDDLGRGKVTTVDHHSWSGSPSPKDVLDGLGLAHYVEIVRVPDSSYLWWLKAQIQARSDDDGNCSPIFDFAYIDGAHNWTIDGLATYLVTKLLRPNGWILLDDLDFTFQHVDSGVERANATAFPMSEAEKSEPHMRRVFDLILRQHPDFDEFVVEDDAWGWGHKGTAARRYRLVTTRSTRALVVSGLRRVARKFT